MKTALLMLAALATSPAAPAAALEQSHAVAAELKTATGMLYGTLLLPAGAPPYPVALIIAGSGPTDRNGNANIGLDTDCYKLLAQALAEHGIATLRYDKRGIAASAAAASSESELRFSTYVDDAAAWLARLRADKRFSPVAVIGHSEGALIGAIAAHRAHADGYVSLAGAGEAAPALLRRQLKAELPAELDRKADAIIDSLAQGKTVVQVPPSLAVLFRPSVQPYLISWFQYDPAREIAKLDMPVLVVQGGRDLQVSVRDAKRLAAADPAAKLLVLPHMNHVLKGVGPTIDDNRAAYTDPSIPLDPKLATTLVEFIRALPQGDHYAN